MKSLLKEWGRIVSYISGKDLVLFLDFDGTLAPLAETPAKARMPHATRQLLQRLSFFAGVRIAIISGRSLGSLKEKVSIPHLVYAGNHGYEISGDSIYFTPPLDKKYLMVLQNIRKNLSNDLSSIPGILIEDKRYTIAIHYRRVPARYLDRVKKVLDQNILPHIKMIKVKTGKKVYEIQPPLSWDKGKTVSWLLRNKMWLSHERKRAVVYIGDDTTDEDAFKTLKKTGITVIVGRRGKTNARYYLGQCKDVVTFLERLMHHYTQK